MSKSTQATVRAKMVLASVNESAAVITAATPSSDTHSYEKGKKECDLAKIEAEMKEKDDKGKFSTDETSISYTGVNASAMDKIAEKHSLSKK